MSHRPPAALAVPELQIRGRQMVLRPRGGLDIDPKPLTHRAATTDATERTCAPKGEG